jgi:hypothetical protein
MSKPRAPTRPPWRGRNRGWWSPATAATAWWKRPTASADLPPARQEEARPWSATACAGATGDEGVIEKIEPRRNLFYRQDEIRTKSFAANLDQVLILIAAEPEFSESQLARALIAAEAEASRRSSR